MSKASLNAAIRAARAARAPRTPPQKHTPPPPPDSPKATPPQPAPVPAFVIEVQDALGAPQPGTGYTDATGAPTGTATCSECRREILVAYHENRPSGQHPILLDTRKDARFPWRAYRKQDSDTILCVFAGRGGYGGYLNHRILCPEARPTWK